MNRQQRRNTAKNTNSMVNVQAMMAISFAKSKCFDTESANMLRDITTELLDDAFEDYDIDVYYLQDFISDSHDIVFDQLTTGANARFTPPSRKSINKPDMEMNDFNYLINISYQLAYTNIITFGGM